MRNILSWFKGFNFGGNGGGSSAGYSDPWGYGFARLPGSNYDYRTEAGNLWENSILSACIKWTTKNFSQARLIMERKKGDEWTPIDYHPLLQLLEKPNPDYDRSVIEAGLILSRLTDGNGYIYMEPGHLGPNSLYYIPHFQMSILYPANGSKFISGYAYRPAGATKTQIFEAEHVLHSRDGIDPLNVRRGLSPCAALLREICADNEASTAAAALMRNLGVAGHVFTPKDTMATDDAQMVKFARLFREKTTGERRGEPLMLTAAGTMTTLGFQPNQLAFDVIRKLPESRITGALGIPAIVVGMIVGLEHGTFANYEQARKLAYESMLVPLWDAIGKEYSQQMLPLYGSDAGEYRVRYDYSQVAALSENADAMHQRVREDFKQGLVTRAEARESLGLDADPKRDDVFYQDIEVAPSIPETAPPQAKALFIAREAAWLKRA